MSFFTKLIAIRDELGNKAKENAYLVSILDNDIPTDRDASIQFDKIAFNYDNLYEEITIVNHNLLTDNTLLIEREDLIDNLDQVIPGTSMTISDYLSSANNSGELYQALSLLTAKFSYTSRIPLKDINDIIDSATTTNAIPGYNFRDLRYSLMNCTNDEGFVTGRAWLVILKEWFKNGDDTVASGAASIDETNPFSLAGIINLVLDTVFSTIGQILQAVHTILSSILGVIASLVAKVFGTINDYLSSGLEVEWDVPNNFVKGSVQHYEEYPSLLNLVGIEDNIPKTRQIYFCETYGVGRFYWWNDDYTKIRMNYYLHPSLTAARVKNYIIANPAVIDYVDFGNVLGCVFRTGLQNLYIEQNDTDENEIFSSPQNIMLSLCVDAFVRELATQAASTWGQFVPDFTVDATHNYGISGYGNDAVSIGARAVSNLLRGLDQFNNISIVNLQDAVTDLVKTNFESNYSRLSQMNNVPDSSNDYQDYYNVTNYYSYPNYTKEIRSIMHLSGPKALGFFHINYDGASSPKFERKFNFTVNGQNPLVESDGLPSQWKISLNSITLSFVIFLTISTAVIATAAAYGYLKASAAIRQRRIIKQSIRTRNIESAKKAWDDDPDNKEKAKAYAKEVDKFNRVGRILGWGSYDAANSWVDYPSKGNSNPSLLDQTFSTLSNSSTAKTAAVLAAERAGLISEDTAKMLNPETGISQEIKNYIDDSIDQFKTWIDNNLIKLIK